MFSSRGWASSLIRGGEDGAAVARGGFSVEMPAEEMKFKKSLGLADKLGRDYALIVGGDEVASGKFTLKRLADGEQKKLTEGIGGVSDGGEWKTDHVVFGFLCCSLSARGHYGKDKVLEP